MTGEGELGRVEVAPCRPHLRCGASPYDSGWMSGPPDRSTPWRWASSDGIASISSGGMTTGIPPARSIARK